MCILSRGVKIVLFRIRASPWVSDLIGGQLALMFPRIADRAAQAKAG